MSLSDTLISALKNAYSSIFVVNMRTDEITTVHLTEEYTTRVSRVEEEKNFYNRIRDGLERNIYPADREYVSRMFSRDNILRTLSQQDSFSFTYRIRSEKLPHYMTCGIIRAGEQFVVCIRDTHAEDVRQIRQEKQRALGTIALSSDILTKANIGLWAFELDEGKPPRMYVDEAMLGLIGLTEQISPEETYHAWYDHIDEGSYDLVAESVEKMTAGEHAEVQYPWHHPNGETWVVRCGGVRNYEYTEGVRIEGTHQNITALIHFDEAERKQAKQIESQFIVSQFRADSLAYIADNDPDLGRALDFFGKRILEISGCDQVIYRDLNGDRTVLNAPGVEDIPQRICSACPFSAFSGAEYGDQGIVLMDDCREGFRGVMAHPNCPARSSFMQRIYSEGELVGLLTVHYLRSAHKFSEGGISIMKSFAMYLGLLIGRINRKKEELARIEAESASRSKTEFLFNMSHDIRTPMNAILGYTDIALRHADDPAQTRDSLTKIRTAGGHLLSLINDILEMSRIEAGKLELTPVPVDIRRAIVGVVQMNQALATAKSIDFSTDYEDITDPYVHADELHVNEIIINLLSNAVKYTPAGGSVRYTARQLGEPRDGIATYRFEISDNGIGMSE